MPHQKHPLLPENGYTTSEAECALAEAGLQNANEEEQTRFLEQISICPTCGEFLKNCTCEE